MSWRDEIYSGEEKSLLQEIRRLRQVVRDLENENADLKEKLERLTDSNNKNS